uniref:Serine/threonine protein kinase n=1 Tax=Cyanothece sp. (strain PCC 7425 / ATCC 29141) TaxID=395961 RepID=B8HVH0_CYAP4
MYSRKQKRRRGVVLTVQGLNRLQAAQTQAECCENHGKRYTLHELSGRTGLSIDTLMKVRACEAGVDRQTLKSYFKSFGLELELGDYQRPNEIDSIDNIEELPDEPFSMADEPEYPEGQVPLNSPFYLERPPIETECYRAIMRPGTLIRVKASRGMGKTSLIARILQFAAQQSCKPVLLSLRLADKSMFQSLEQFLRWFSASVTLELQLPHRLEEYWDEIFGSKISCKYYFEQYLLTELKEPLVLALDDVDRLFLYPELADEFFGMLRAWHEEAKNRDIWKKLRLIVAHSEEVYIPLNCNQSPFNVGLPVELPELNPEQVQELAERHGLNWSMAQVDQLMSMVGGQPYLVRKALYHIGNQETTLEELLATAPTQASIYREHLDQKLWKLQQDSDLAVAFSYIVETKSVADLNMAQLYKLQSMGLVALKGKQAELSCNLYAQYFRERF